ncbi:hypothetical protein [Sphingomonas sp. SAFR-052]|uniref:hypothetical protein n=1 Tax=Sphingomonas sp. SAFR-052 TaxID=3436867 RepID=UPI003F7CE0B2
MSRHERVVIELAVAILRKGVEESGNAKVDTIAVRLALRCLLPHCRETWPLTTYWESAGQDNEIGRSQGVTAAFNGIVRQLRLTGAWRD